MSDTTTSVSPTGSGAAGDRRQQVEQVISALNAHDEAKYASYYSPDAVVCTPASPEPLRGRSVIQQDTEEIFTAVPDWEVRVEEAVVDGPTAVSRVVAVGTRTGPMVMPSGEILPSGRQMSTSMAVFSRLGDDGLIVEEHRYFDVLEMLQQMGVA